MFLFGTLSVHSTANQIGREILIKRIKKMDCVYFLLRRVVNNIGGGWYRLLELGRIPPPPLVITIQGSRRHIPTETFKAL